MEQIEKSLCESWERVGKSWKSYFSQVGFKLTQLYVKSTVSISPFSHGDTDGMADPGIGPGHSGQQSCSHPTPRSHAHIDVQRVIGPTFGRKLRPAPGIFLSCRRDHWRHHRSPGGVTIVSAIRASNITNHMHTRGIEPRSHWEACMMHLHYVRRYEHVLQYFITMQNSTTGT